MKWLAHLKDFWNFLGEEDEKTPLYTPSEGLERKVYEIVAKYGWSNDGVGDIMPSDHIVRDLWYDTDLLDNVALQTNLWKDLGVDVPLEIINTNVGEIYNCIEKELEAKRQKQTEDDFHSTLQTYGFGYSPPFWD